MTDDLTKARAPFVVASGRVSEGDFALFYRSNRDRVGRALALTFNDEHLGLEAVDEAMTRACRQWDVVGEISNPAGWVYRVGLNWGRSWLRRKMTATRRKSDVAMVSRSSRSPSQSIENLALDTDLARAIGRLSNDARAVVVLRYYEDQTVNEIAEILEVAPGTVKSRLSRAVARLKIELGDYERGDV